MRQSHVHLFFFLFLGLLLPGATPGAAGEIIPHVDIDWYYISPNSDGVQDSMIITYSLADSAESVFVLVLGADSSVVDTLVDHLPQPAGSYTTVWKGEYSSGDPVPEGAYLVFVEAFRALTGDSIYRSVYVDITAPSVSITLLQPGVFAPDIDTLPPVLTVDFDVWNSPPADSDYVRIFIYDPDNDSYISELAPFPDFCGNGSYQTKWDGSEISVDGIYTIKIFVRDRAGNSSSDWASINVDNDPPSLRILSPQEGAKMPAIPDSVYGWAWDRNGVSSVSVKFSSNSPYEGVASTSLRFDTLFFSTPLADSITEERRHTVSFKAYDSIGREKTLAFHITFDSTPPAPPVLAEPEERVTRVPSHRLKGSFSSDAFVVRIFKNGSFIDSLITIAISQISLQVPLSPGSNLFTAYSLDDAGNISSPSNSIEVVFNNTAGLFLPQPFRPNDAFQVNLTANARYVSIKIYDLGGDLVTALGGNPSAETVSIPWNGLNGDGESAKKGPFLAVAHIRYMDGGSEIMRQIFLFEP